METKTSLIIVVVAYLVLGLGMANAQVITIGIEAVVDGVMDSTNALEGKVNAGDLITGSYTYDTLTPDTATNPDIGRYWHYTSPYGVSLSAGGFVFETDPANVDFVVEIVNGNGRDGYLFRSYNNVPLSNSVMVDHISWQLDDYSGQAMSSTLLPSTGPVLSAWPESNWLHVTGDKETSYFTISAQVTSVQVVPEPATIVLFGLGLAFLGKRNKTN